MLKILVPMLLTLLLLSSNFWRTMPMLLFMLTLMSTTLHHPFNNIMSLSPMFSVDHLSAPLISMTLWVSAITIPISLLPMLKSHYPLSMPVMNTLLAMTLVLAFSLNNLLTFYIMFETSLIPTLLLILMWGYQPDRLQASFYMMMYTVSASLPLLFSILLLMSESMQLNMFLFMQHSPMNTNTSLWWAMCILAFLVKIPLYSMHLWLPKAHVEAPTAGSMLLASILLKLGGYGLIRLTSMFQPLMTPFYPMLMSISMLGATITGLICLRQTDLKALIAYSSVAHMALMVAGISSMSQWGWAGALTMMLAHGLSSPAMFSLAGVTYETTNTRSLFLTKGLLALLPNTCMWWFIATAANMAAPPSMNLMSEIMLLTSILSKSALLTPLVFLTTFLAVAYSLHLYTATQHGPPPKFMTTTQPAFPTHYTSFLLLLSPVFIMTMKPEILLAWL